MGDFTEDMLVLSLKTLMYCSFSVSEIDEWYEISAQDLCDISEMKFLEYKSLGIGRTQNTIPHFINF